MLGDWTLCRRVISGHLAPSDTCQVRSDVLSDLLALLRESGLPADADSTITLLCYFHLSPHMHQFTSI